MNALAVLTMLILGTAPLPDVSDEGRAAPPNPNSDWTDLSVPERIPVVGTVFVRAQYVPTFESDMTVPDELDALIAVRLYRQTDEGEVEVAGGETTYDEVRQVAMWQSDGPLEEGAPYVVRLELRFHESPERVEGGMFMTKTLVGPWPGPLAPLPPLQFDTEMVCGDGNCCPAQLSLRGRLAPPDVDLRAEFAAEGSDQWVEEAITFSQAFYFVDHTYPSFGPEACYRLTAVSLLDGAEASVVHCLPNPAPMTVSGNVTTEEQAGPPCTSVPEGLPAGNDGCSASPTGSPIPWVMCVLWGYLWRRPRSAWAADQRSQDPGSRLV